MAGRAGCITALVIFGLLGCAEHDEVCLEWQTQACEAYHQCGMMGGVGDCDEHAAYACSPDAPVLETAPHCEGLSERDVAPCSDYIRHKCPTFEELTEVPQCSALMSCLGWPM